jgi:hypothetical protein
MTVKRGILRGCAAGRETERGIWCYVCGRPLAAGEDLGPWRVRAWRPSPTYDYWVVVICPAHYAPGEPPPLPLILKPEIW